MSENRPLEGIRVADFTWALAGPIAGKILAAYGAEVIKIEGRTRIDQQRTAGFFKNRIIPESVNCGSNFNLINTGKMSLALNLSLPEGAATALKLGNWADVVIENFAGGVMDRMGLGYEDFRKVKPDIIMLSSCMMGQTGPHAWMGGIGTQLAGLSGTNHIAGWPDRDPRPVGPYSDFIAPQFSVLAIMAALDYRRRTGKGQYIDLSQYENTIHFMAPLLLDYQSNGRVANRMGNRHASAVPHGAFPCKGEERWCTIAVCNDYEWESFCRITGHPEWVSDPRFRSFLDRKRNEDALNLQIEAWTRLHDAEDVMKRMQEAGIAAGVVSTAEDMMDKDPQLAHRGFFQEIEHPEVGTYRRPRPAYLFSGASAEAEPAPLLGEHTEYVLREVIGLSDDDIEELVIAGAVE